MKRTLIVLAIGLFLVVTAVYASRPSRTAQDPGPTPTPQDTVSGRKQAQPKVDLVIALDTSGSMSGLINAARQKLWDIVNEVAQAQPTPRLRVGLVTFGSSGTEEDGFVVVRSDLTTDLDTINAKLFELGTAGGTEYVGRAIFRSVNELSWSKDPDALKQIYVAGNESADQDRAVRATDAVTRAMAEGIFVNAIYCGNDSDGIAPSWRAVAKRGDGMYAAIDHNHGTVAIRTPYDDRLNALSSRLNRTYMGYGRRAPRALLLQKAQDKNARRLHSSTGAARAVAKASGVYQNADWDLVDAKKVGTLKSIRKEALPEPLKALSAEELGAVVEKKAAEREAIKKEIREISKKRTAYVADEMRRQGKSGGKAFDTAVKRALRAQAAKKNIKLKK